MLMAVLYFGGWLLKVHNLRIPWSDSFELFIAPILMLVGLKWFADRNDKL
jgi:hypothetical protein